MIQSVIRRYLSNKHLKINLLKVSKAHEGRLIAIMRVRARKNKLSKPINSPIHDDAESRGKRLNDTLFSAIRSSPKGFNNSNDFQNYSTSPQSQRSEVRFSPIAPSTPIRSNSRPLTSNMSRSLINSTDELYQNSDSEEKNKINIIKRQYESVLSSLQSELHEVRSELNSRQQIFSKNAKNNINVGSSYPPINMSNDKKSDGSLQGLIKAHNNHALNKKSRPGRHKNESNDMMQQEISTLLLKFEDLESRIHDQQQLINRTEEIVKVEVMKVRMKSDQDLTNAVEAATKKAR